MVVVLTTSKKIILNCSKKQEGAHSSLMVYAIYFPAI